MDVKWTNYAANDLISIENHISRDSIQYSLVVVDRILDRVLQLESFPESGSIVPEYERVDIREIFVHSYRIIHQLHTNHIRILTVCHGANPLPRKLPEIQ